MKPGYYWVALKDYPVWFVALYCDGKFYQAGSTRGVSADVHIFEGGPLEPPLGVGHVVTLADHPIVRHHTYTGQGCARCGKMDELHPKGEL